MPSAFRIFLALSTVLFSASVAYLAVQLKFNHALHHGLPLDLYTRLPFYDLVGYVVKMPQVHQPGFFSGAWPFVYPAPSVLLFKFFTLFAILPIRHAWFGSILAYLLFVAAGLWFLGHRYAAALQRRGLSAGSSRLFSYGSFALSWPILYSVHQGNIEALLWMGLAVSLWFYRENRWMSFAMAIGVFGSFKLYPLIFLLLLVPLRQWKPIAVGVLVFGLLTIGSIAYIGPTFALALQHISSGIRTFNDTGLSVAGLTRDSRPFDHSLDGLLHLMLRLSPAAIGLVVRWYIPVVAVLYLALFVKIRSMPRANLVLFLSLGAVTLPSISFDYTLEMLYIPCAWIALEGITDVVSGVTPQWLMPVMVCFALVFSPELFLSVHGLLFYGQFKAVVLLLLLGFSVAVPIEASMTTSHVSGPFQLGGVGPLAAG